MKIANIKTDEQRRGVCLSIIRHLRHFDSFTLRTASLVTGLKISRATTLIKMLEGIGCVYADHKYGRQVYYVFDDYAVSKLKNHFRTLTVEESVAVELTHPPEPEMLGVALPKKTDLQKIGGTVVDKAYFEPGFGRSFINHIDTMLREVRCGMPAMR